MNTVTHKYKLAANTMSLFINRMPETEVRLESGTTLEDYYQKLVFKFQLLDFLFLRFSNMKAWNKC